MTVEEANEIIKETNPLLYGKCFYCKYNGFNSDYYVYIHSLYHEWADYDKGPKIKLVVDYLSNYGYIKHQHLFYNDFKNTLKKEITELQFKRKLALLKVGKIK